MKKNSTNLIKGWLPIEEKMPTQALHQSTLKTEVAPLFTGLGVGLVVLGLGFCFFSSYYIESNLPVEVVLNVISHYLVGIAVGCAFLVLGAVLVVLGMKKSQNRFSIQVQAVEKWINGWFPKEPTLSNATGAVQTLIASEREKAYRRKVASVLMGVSGVFAGWGAAGYAYFYLSRTGVTANEATIYASIVWISILGIFWLVAFNLKRIQEIFTKELKA